MRLSCGVLTISDRAASGERADLSGPAIITLMVSHGWDIANQAVVADNLESIRETLIAWCDSGKLDCLLTTGGTGFAPRDITPEATRSVVNRPAPGLVEAMRAASLVVTPHAMLSRAEAGIRGRTLIINLPGSPKGALENIEVILPVLPHAVQLLQEDPDSEAGHILQE